MPAVSGGFFAEVARVVRRVPRGRVVTYGEVARMAGRPMLVHYSPIEQNFISAACEHLYGAPFVTPIIDTLEIGQRVFERRNHLIQPGDLRLFNLRPRYNLPHYKAHNALSDAISTAELFLAMADNLYPGRPCPLGEFLSRR